MSRDLAEPPAWPSDDAFFFGCLPLVVRVVSESVAAISEVGQRGNERERAVLSLVPHATAPLLHIPGAILGVI